MTKFQLRFSQALAHKPKGNSKSKSDGHSEPFDPFESPPPELFIADLPPSHKLVLNKFAIVPEHFILATSAFKEQTHLLEEADLAATYACLRAYKTEGLELYAFFNSGEHSGASQRHRHIQLLPVQSMTAGLESKGAWSPLIDRLVADGASLPFATFAAPLPADISPRRLHELYLSLYYKACAATGIESTQNEGEAQINYNIGLTDSSLVVCPRRAEGVNIVASQGEGFVGLNGTLLAGTLLVKSEVEWDILRSGQEQLHKVLGAIGFPAPVASSGKL